MKKVNIYYPLKMLGEVDELLKMGCDFENKSIFFRKALKDLIEQQQQKYKEKLIEMRKQK